MSDVLPTGWQTAEIADIAEYVQRGKSPQYVNTSDLPVINQKCVRWRGVDPNHLKFVHPDQWASWSPERFVVPGDILWNSTGTGTIGRAALFTGLSGFERAVVDSHVTIVRTTPGVSSRYLHYFIMSPEIQRRIDRMQSGSTNQVELNREEVLRTTLPLPPLNEQRRIVAKIEALMACSTRAKEALDAIPALLDRYRQSVLAAAFRGDLTADWRAANHATPIGETLKKTPLPQQSKGGRQATTTVIPGVGGMAINNPKTPLPPGWEWVPLLRIARQETGHTPSRKKPEYWDGDVPWIGIRDAGDHHGDTINDTRQHVTQEGLANSSARLLPAGTVCLSRTASVGYVVMMGRDMATSQDFATWTCSKALDPYFLMYGLLSEGDQIRRFGEGSTHTTIYFPEIRALHIALAPVDEQREVVRRVQKAFATVRAVEEQLYGASAKLPTLNQSILAKAFRGELVPQDPDDEPASVLLARIKAERAAADPTARRGRRRKPNTSASA